MSTKDDPEACKKVAKSFYDTGALIIRDPRAKEENNQAFLRMIERYFESRSKLFYKGQKVPEVFAEDGYQHGATPELIEVARNHEDRMRALKGGNRAVSPVKPLPDKKWRYFWRMGDAFGENLQFDSKRVVPQDFPEWEKTMDAWGMTLRNGVEVAGEMLALGLDLPRTAFTERMKGAPHLLAPTGSDLGKFNKLGDVLAGYHYDLNFLTIHGKSNFPGLFVWLRDGTKVPVKVPDGCLLLQSSKELEYLTGGYLQAGYHEVVVTEETQKAIEKAKKEKKSTWRVSSTLFGGIRYDVSLEPLGKFANAESRANYPPVSAYDHTLEELKHINLFKP